MTHVSSAALMVPIVCTLIVRTRDATRCTAWPRHARVPGGHGKQSTSEGKESAMDSTRQQVAVVVGATSKWQADGRNTQLAHGKVLDDSHLPVGVRKKRSGCPAACGGGE